jgi:hypothetical protein
LQFYFWIRILIIVPVLALFFLAQAYWFRKIWALAGRIPLPALRRLAQGVSAATVLFVGLSLLFDAFSTRRDILWRYAGIVGVVGLWVTSALWAYIAVMAVAAADWFWRLAARICKPTPAATLASDAPAAEPELMLGSHSAQFVDGYADRGRSAGTRRLRFSWAVAIRCAK